MRQSFDSDWSNNYSDVRDDIVIEHKVPERFRHRGEGLAAAQAEAGLQGHEIRQDILELADVPAPGDVAEQLGIAAGETVFVRRRLVGVADGPPLQLADSYIPLGLANDQIRCEDSGPGGTYARIEDQGHPIRRYQEQIVRQRAATADEREQLQLDDGKDLVIDFRRVAYADAGPVECLVAVMAAGRHRFTYDVSAP